MGVKLSPLYTRQPPRFIQRAARGRYGRSRRIPDPYRARDPLDSGARALREPRPPASTTFAAEIDEGISLLAGVYGDN